MRYETSLGPGIGLTCESTKTDRGSIKFKSAVMSVTFVTPLRRETAAVNALIPDILRQGTSACPDLHSLAAALDELYGGSVEPLVRKKGDTQCVGFVASFLDDSCLPSGETILKDAIRRLGEILLSPALEEGRFRRDYVDREKVNLRDRIAAELNDKRQYALNRLMEEMYAGDPYGVGRFGRLEDVDAITPDSAWSQYQTLLRTCPIEVYYSGSADPQAVRDCFAQVFAALPRKADELIAIPATAVLTGAREPRWVEERMDVAQGKLTMGFRVGGVTAASPQYPALALANALFGGTTTSKLFLNVREKLSLCYYASSGLQKNKGSLIVSSGVEPSDRDRAEKEIMAQLAACQRGEFEDWELAGARAYLVSSLRAVPDSQGRTEDWWLGQRVCGPAQTTQELARAIEQVPRQDIVAAAGLITLDTVYFLSGKEEG